MTVRELLAALLDCPWDATVTIGHGPGPVGTLTPTVNGYVIIDAAAAPFNDVSAPDINSMVADLVTQVAAPTVPGKCPDGGACGHGCDAGCWRVRYCGPLSGVYPGDQWPEYLKENG